MHDESEKTRKFIEELIQEIPELTPVYQEHIDFNREILPYVLLDEFSRFVIEKITPGQGKQIDTSLLERFASLLESTLEEGDGEVSTAIRTTFCESVDGLWKEKSLHHLILAFLGPHLKECLSIK